MAKAMIKKTDRQKTEEENKKKNKYADEEKQKLSFREWMKQQQQQQQQHSLSHSWAMSGRSWSQNSSCCWRESHANTAREKEKKRIPPPPIIATEKEERKKRKDTPAYRCHPLPNATLEREKKDRKSQGKNQSVS